MAGFGALTALLPLLRDTYSLQLPSLMILNDNGGKMPPKTINGADTDRVLEFLDLRKWGISERHVPE